MGFLRQLADLRFRNEWRTIQVAVWVLAAVCLGGSIILGAFGR